MHGKYTTQQKKSGLHSAPRISKKKMNGFQNLLRKET